MADQATSNEDVGITQLKISVNATQGYPYDTGNGWVVFEEDDDYIVVGIDPSVGGLCPGGLTVSVVFIFVFFCPLLLPRKSSS